MKSLAVFAVLVTSAVGGLATGEAGEEETADYAGKVSKSCAHRDPLRAPIHRSSVARNRIRKLVFTTAPTVEKKRVRHYVRCVATLAKAKAGARLAEAGRAWRKEYAQVWEIRFRRLPAYDQAWAYSTGGCESGNNPATATGNGYYGAFQFLLSTWYAAGGTGSPSQHSWFYQAIVAVRWRNIAGAGQWPVCG